MKTKPNEETRTVALDPNPKGQFKMVGGSLADKWNLRLVNLVGGSLPIDHSDSKASKEAVEAVIQATMDIAPADPIEGILIAQLMAANEAALSMYRKGWAQGPEYFQARTKYLQLADKAARTVMMLTERLDHHRGRGQQQITVKHVTTNNVTADQAIIADSVTTGGAARNVASPALLAASSVMPMPILSETRVPDPVGVGGGTKSKCNPMQSAHDAPRCKAKSKRTGKACRAPAVRGCRVCRMHGARGGAPEGKRNGNFRHGRRTKEVTEASRFISQLARLVRDLD